MQNNTIGSQNVALGQEALRQNLLSDQLVAVGDSALYSNGVGAFKRRMRAMVNHITV